jgi:hypothetical protein
VRWDAFYLTVSAVLIALAYAYRKRPGGKSVLACASFMVSTVVILDALDMAEWGLFADYLYPVVHISGFLLGITIWRPWKKCNIWRLVFALLYVLALSVDADYWLSYRMQGRADSQTYQIAQNVLFLLRWLAISLTPAGYALADLHALALNHAPDLRLSRARPSAAARGDQ